MKSRGKRDASRKGSRRRGGNKKCKSRLDYLGDHVYKFENWDAESFGSSDFNSAQKHS